MKNTKKIIALLLAVIAILGIMTACGKTKTDPAADPSVAEASGSDLKELSIPESTSSNLEATMLMPKEVTDVAGVRFSVPTYFETTETTTYSDILAATLAAATSGSDEDKALVEKLSSLPIRLAFSEGYVYMDTKYGITMIAASPYDNAPEDLSTLTEEDFINAFTSYAVNESEAPNVEFAAFNGREANKAAAALIYHYGSGTDNELVVRGQVCIIRSETTGNAFVLSAFDSSTYFNPEAVAESFVIDDENPGCGIEIPSEQ